MLIKKTIVLLTDGAVCGSITLIRIGDTAGIKVSLNNTPREKLFLGLNCGEGDQIHLPLSGAKTEADVVCLVSARSEPGAVIIDASGRVYASGGRKDTVNYKALMEFAAPKISAEPETPPVGAVSAAPETPPVENVNAAPEEPSAPPPVDAAEEEKPQIEILPEGLSPNPFDIKSTADFYAGVRTRLDEIMTINPKAEILEKIMPDSRWVKVFYDGEDYYVVGTLTDEGRVTHIAYGVPGVASVKPPKEAEELCDFLPIGNGGGEGFWLMFQNAETGEIVKTI